MPLDFAGVGRPLTAKAVNDGIQSLGIEKATFWAVMSVETRGFGFLPDRRPKILYERHIFHKRTDGKFSAKHQSISNAKRGGYGKDGAHQFARLAEAIALNRQAALESASWGLGQVMGFNASEAGHKDVFSLVTAMSAGESEQTAAMVAFILHNKLDSYLQKRKWAGFALHYNGSSYKDNLYDVKLEQAYNLYSLHPTPSLDVRAAQAALTYLGFDTKGVDGVFGNNTQAALISYQKSIGLTPDGKFTDAILERLSNDAFP